MTPIERKARELLPCPWCGDELTDCTVSEGSTFRWRKVDGCCTDGPEVRHNTMADDQDEAEADSTRRAIEAWNTRAALTPPAGGLPELPAPARGGSTPDGAQVAHGADATDEFTDPLFTTDTLHAYALEAIAASRDAPQVALNRGG